MAKGTTATASRPKTQQQQTPPKNAVAKRGSTSVGEVDPELLKMMEGDSGKGVSTDAADNIVPLIYVLQTNSPGLDRANATAYLGKEAKAGDLWFRGTKDYVSAEPEEKDDGLRVVPIYFSKCWIEWRPDRGGFAGRHKDRPSSATEKLEKKEGSDAEKRVWRMPNGNSVQETREYVVMVLDCDKLGGKPTPFVIPMTSTNHTPAREWMTLINKKTVPGTDKPAAIYSHVYRVTTVNKTNDEGSWYMFKVTDALCEEDGSYSAELLGDIGVYREAKKIAEQFAKGELRADVGDEETVSGESNAAGNDDDGM